MQDFAAEPQELRDEMLAAVSRVMSSGQFVLGTEVRAFEAAFASANNAGFAIGVGNGLDAIELIVRASGLGPGDEVITTSMSAFATVLGIMRAGATPVLADIEPDSAALSLESVQRCIGPQTRALLLVHLYGAIADPAPYQALCEAHGLTLLEDCAQATGARWCGQAAGTFGTAGAFSFYPTKNLGALGDGGAVVTDDPQLAARVATLRHYGQQAPYVHIAGGMNSRLDEMQAAILGVRLRHLSRWNEDRRTIARAYVDGIRHPLVTVAPFAADAESAVHHLFVIRCTARDTLRSWLDAHEVQTLSHYPTAIHHQPAATGLRSDPHGLPNSERHARECLSLPCHPHLKMADVRHVIDAVNAFPVHE